jgi:phosphoglycerate dehydrogenase-like enzyme
MLRAAITEKALAAVRVAEVSGVEVSVLPDGLEEAAFVVPAGEPDVLEALPGLRALRVVQTLSAGTDWVEDAVPPWATLCNARGSRDVPVAEWVAGALLGAVYGQFRMAHERAWHRFRPGELHGRRILILGHGSIGRALAARLEPFGVEVVGVARRERPGVHAIGELPALLPGADALVVLAPLTADTRGLVDAATLAALPDGALVVNAGRGAVVDTDALVAELRNGRLSAVLDVTDPEPLPDGHPLWELALAVTPHNAGDTAAADDRAAQIAAEQLARFARGEPLEHVVRAAAG